MKYQIINGDNRAVLKTFPDNHFDSIVTDPPYGIDFLGKAWDANTGALETYQECLRVLKPGGHILAFSAARTYHHLAITLEQAGFEIRDQIMWIYSSGFPKSQDVGRSIERSKNKQAERTKSAGYNPSGENKPVDIGVNGFRCYTCGKDSAARYDCKNDPCQLHPPLEDDEAKQWSGWGTALKPAHEPIALARKPIKGSIKDNVLNYGVGALNIDATRVPYVDEKDMESAKFGQDNTINPFLRMYVDKQEAHKANSYSEPNAQGRFPSNVLGEIPDYQKYFYCPKVSRKERHAGFDPNSQGNIIDSEVFGKTPICLDCGKTRNGSTKHDDCDPTNIGFQERRTERSTEVGNNHPTVKPIELMKYLIKLITPAGGIVLDPFNGSGSTGCAAVELGFEYVGIELDANYVEIANKRIAAWNKEDTSFNEIFE